MVIYGKEFLNGCSVYDENKMWKEKKMALGMQSIKAKKRNKCMRICVCAAG